MNIFSFVSKIVIPTIQKVCATELEYAQTGSATIIMSKILLGLNFASP